MVTDVLNVLVLIALAATAVGLFYPEKVIFWKKGNANRNDVIRWYMSSFILLALLTAFLNNNQ